MEKPLVFVKIDDRGIKLKQDRTTGKIEADDKEGYYLVAEIQYLIMPQADEANLFCWQYNGGVIEIEKTVNAHGLFVSFMHILQESINKLADKKETFTTEEYDDASPSLGICAFGICRDGITIEAHSAIPDEIKDVLVEISDIFASTVMRFHSKIYKNIKARISKDERERRTKMLDQSPKNLENIRRNIILNLGHIILNSPQFKHGAKDEKILEEVLDLSFEQIPGAFITMREWLRFAVVIASTKDIGSIDLGDIERMTDEYTEKRYNTVVEPLMHMKCKEFKHIFIDRISGTKSKN